MNTGRFNYARLGGVFLYAAAMAWVEAAVVFDLRTLVHRIVPYQPDPLPLIGGLGPVEVVREAATLVMLLTVGLLAGRTGRARLGYAALAFGVWDFLYYLFLKVICGWPHSWLDWDILFLLPLPWWGPVLAPMCIAGLMVIWGVLASREEACATVSPPGRFRRWTPWALNGMGVGVALYVFMFDALHASGRGVEAVRQVLPQHFHWPLFGVALALMAAPIFPGCGRGGRAPATRRWDGGAERRSRGDCRGALT